MTIEEKTKAIDIVKQMIVDGQVSQEVAEKYFPELAESEDEKIRKALIRFFQRFPYDRLNYENLKSEEAIAWLEKQSNQREQLINKACDILVNCIEDYMLRRMEMWSEECKNQTLENIRKKLEE